MISAGFHLLKLIFQSFAILGTVFPVAYAADPAAVSPEKLLNEIGNAEDLEGSALLNTRDPFNPPSLVVESAIERSELETIPLENIRLSGIIVGLDKNKAILITPGGKTHIVGVGTKIGVRKGFVKKITPTSIVVRERFANVFGKEENVDTEIKLQEKRN